MLLSSFSSDSGGCTCFYQVSILRFHVPYFMASLYETFIVIILNPNNNIKLDNYAISKHNTYSQNVSFVSLSHAHKSYAQVRYKSYLCGILHWVFLGHPVSSSLEDC